MTTTGSKWLHGWLVGADGLHSSEDASDWQLVGGTGHPVHDLIRRPEDLFCATMFGLWQVRDSRQADSPQADEPSPWLQLHDETLTEILGIAPDEGDPGVVAVSPYGLAFGAQVDGVHRWQSRCDGLTLNERFSSAVLPHPLAPGHWIVATEDGVRIYSDSDGQTQGQWEGTDLTGLPCRALLYAHDRLWAATDGGGIWRSDDGSSWRRAGT
ncbi:MAG: hypothetical protein HN559_14390, partial [Gemmatimonadetes bacterium]|nr:hypothetical protein [Gemmatimonadota bacterium]